MTSSQVEDFEIVAITQKRTPLKASKTFLPHDNVAISAARARACGVEPASGYHRENRHERMRTCQGQCANRICSQCSFKCSNCDTPLCARCTYHEEDVLQVAPWQPILDQVFCRSCVRSGHGGTAVWKNDRMLPHECYVPAQQQLLNAPVLKGPLARLWK